MTKNLYDNLPNDIKNGLTFRQLVIGFAPSVMGVINRNKQLKPNPEYAKMIKAAKAELKRCEALTPEEIDAENQNRYEKAMAEHEAIVKERTELRTKYKELIKMVEEWMPDSVKNPELVQLRFLMMRDLNALMEQECYIPKSSPTLNTADQWFKEWTDNVKSDLEYAKARHQFELKAIHNLYEILLK